MFATGDKICVDYKFEVLRLNVCGVEIMYIPLLDGHKWNIIIYCNHHTLGILSPTSEVYSSAAEIRLPQSYYSRLSSTLSKSCYFISFIIVIFSDIILWIHISAKPCKQYISHSV